MKTLRFITIISATVAVGIYLLLMFSVESHRYGWHLFGLELVCAGVGTIGSVIALFGRSGWKFSIPLIACAAILYIQLV
jgi:hypothetical protein